MSKPGAREDIPNRRPRRRSALAAGALASALLATLAACDSVAFEPPASAKIRADAPAGLAGKRVRLISATEFQSTGETPPSVALARADTVDLTLPFTREVEIRSHDGARKLYVELYSLESGSLPVRLRVDIQDLSWYDNTLDLVEWRHRFVFVRG
jgi:hypothetical protein